MTNTENIKREPGRLSPEEIEKKKKKRKHSEGHIKKTLKPKSHLNPQQELFCKLYAGMDRKYFGNGTRAYAEAYGLDLETRKGYNRASVGAHDLLSKHKILMRVRSLLSIGVFNDERVDRELGFLIEQDADFNSKLGAIKEYNSLKARIAKRVDLTSKGESVNKVVIQHVHAGEEEDGADDTEN